MDSGPPRGTGRTAVRRSHLTRSPLAAAGESPVLLDDGRPDKVQASKTSDEAR
jgi:hypothetical protein